MRQVKRWRYYCDHCKKSGGSRHVIEKHERGCTNNPERKCGLHPYVDGGYATATTAELIEVLESKGYRALRAAADECPACILAAMRQSKRWLGDPQRDPYEGLPAFDFKAEVAEVWKLVREAERENASYAGCY